MLFRTNFADSFLHLYNIIFSAIKCISPLIGKHIQVYNQRKTLAEQKSFVIWFLVCRSIYVVVIYITKQTIIASIVDMSWSFYYFNTYISEEEKLLKSEK